MSEEKKTIFLKGYFTHNQLLQIADEMMYDEFTKVPNQDELWEELENTCMNYGDLMIDGAKKRYRITRVK